MRVGGRVTSMQYTLFLNRVLRCFEDHKFKHVALTVEEVTERYNELYPPSLMNRLLGRVTGVMEIQSALARHVESGLLVPEMYSFTDRPLRVPERRYVLTQQGVQQLHRGEVRKRR